MRRQIIALAAMALAASLGTARVPPQHWVRVGTGPAGPIEINRASLNWHDVQHVWWRTIYDQPKPDGSVAEHNLDLVDCVARRSAGIETATVGADGRTIKDQRDPESVARHHLAAPTVGSAGEIVEVNACRLRPPPPKRNQH